MGIGRVLIVLGVILVMSGIIINSGIRVPGFGKLPGDIYVKRDGFSFYFPFTTCLIISLVITFLISLVKWFK